MNIPYYFKRYEVFISSTYKDLRKERSIVMKAILDMGHFPTGMEEFPATDQDQFDYIKRVIDTADYYILIMGGNCGSMYDEEKSISYTRMEYEYALNSGIPIIVFVKSDESGEPLVECDDHFKMEAYRDFLNVVQINRMRRTFRIAEELSGLVFHSLSEEMKTHPRYGWIRDFKPDYNSDKLLLRGRLLYFLCIDSHIYNQEVEMVEVELPYMMVKLYYGRGTQGVFVLSCSCDENVGHNFYYDIDNNVVDCFEEDGYLKEGYSIQLSFARMGNQEEPLLFLTFGDGQFVTETKVYRIGKVDFNLIGTIEGQEYMAIDYVLEVPYGSQGLFDTYVYCNGEIMKTESLNTVEIYNS